MWGTFQPRASSRWSHGSSLRYYVRLHSWFASVLIDHDGSVRKATFKAAPCITAPTVSHPHLINAIKHATKHFMTRYPEHLGLHALFVEMAQPIDATLFTV
jgi:hypothetical protein